MLSENRLSRSAQSVQDVLLAKGLEFKVFEMSASTRTADEAAHSIGCRVAQIVKSLVFCTWESQRPVLVLASGITRVNEKRVSDKVGERIVKADAQFVREVTGYAIGGVPPVAHARPLHTYIDADLLTLGELWAAAGTPNAVFRLAADQLQPLTGGQIMRMK